MKDTRGYSECSPFEQDVLKSITRGTSTKPECESQLRLLWLGKNVCVVWYAGGIGYTIQGMGGGPWYSNPTLDYAKRTVPGARKGPNYNRRTYKHDMLKAAKYIDEHWDELDKAWRAEERRENEERAEQQQIANRKRLLEMSVRIDAMQLYIDTNRAQAVGPDGELEQRLEIAERLLADWKANIAKWDD